MHGLTGMFSSMSCEWETPQHIFDALNVEFGPFELDPCASPDKAKCAHYYSEGGLEKRWAGKIFVNPPYGREIAAWMKKAYESWLAGATVVCLIPSRTDTRWWHDYVMAATEIRFIHGRLRFGGHKNSAPFPSAIAVFRHYKT